MQLLACTWRCQFVVGGEHAPCLRGPCEQAGPPTITNNLPPVASPTTLCRAPTTLAHHATLTAHHAPMSVAYYASKNQTFEPHSIVSTPCPSLSLAQLKQLCEWRVALGVMTPLTWTPTAPHSPPSHTPHSYPCAGQVRLGVHSSLCRHRVPCTQQGVWWQVVELNPSGRSPGRPCQGGGDPGGCGADGPVRLPPPSKALLGAGAVRAHPAAHTVCALASCAVCAVHALTPNAVCAVHAEVADAGRTVYAGRRAAGCALEAWAAGRGAAQAACVCVLERLQGGKAAG